MAWLDAKGMLEGWARLDYGCGKGFDADTLGFTKYDPNHGPDKIIRPVLGFDIITCNYVLNVIENETERTQVLDNIKELLADNGKAYITVRRDIKTEGVTKRGTYQKDIHLDLPIVRQTAGYCTYLMQK